MGAMVLAAHPRLLAAPACNDRIGREFRYERLSRVESCTIFKCSFVVWHLSSVFSALNVETLNQKAEAPNHSDEDFCNIFIENDFTPEREGNCYHGKNTGNY
jgi:hypothetical protein